MKLTNTFTALPVYGSSLAIAYVLSMNIISVVFPLGFEMPITIEDVGRYAMVFLVVSTSVVCMLYVAARARCWIHSPSVES